MNAKHLNATLVVLLAIFLYHPLHAQNTLTVKSVKATIQGSSTLHDWESQITQITCLGDFQSENSLLKTIADISVKIPVAAIKSSEGKMMDNKTYEAFKSDEHPYITYTASRAQITTDAARNTTIKVSGSLTMAGTTKPITVEAKGKSLPNGDMEISIARKLKMTEFNMKPPTAMMGTIKVGDEVTVVVSLVLAQAAAASR
ncbi:YceI family protein [Dawidia soli]|uniref:YceI family protein n=1 Tax=Dawidia soli TaxID=2782352 RepID=A0AAP2GKY4_9BACT|nr:YceI family protein [Dawidia soli]MBT1689558.1 YceI family protein [Dawidia soli]